MAEEKVGRVFVGGLSWDTTERTLERAFGEYGKVIEAQVVVDRDTGRSRGFGFVTFSEPRAVEAAIQGMHNGKLDGRDISVNKAQPRMNSGDGYGYGDGGGGYSSGARGGYRSGADVVRAASDDCFKCGRPGHWARECPYSDGGRTGRYSPARGGYRSGADVVPVASDDCFKCGRSGHWARECPYSDSGRTGKYSPASRYGGGTVGRGDRFGGSDRFASRYDDDRYDSGRYMDSRDTYYSAGRDRYASDRNAPAADHYSGDRYNGADRYVSSGFARERSYEKDRGRSSGSYYRNDPRSSGGYGRGRSRVGGGGPARFGGSYRDRPAPYDRPVRAAHTYDDRY